MNIIWIYGYKEGYLLSKNNITQGKIDYLYNTGNINFKGVKGYIKIISKTLNLIEIRLF